MTELVDGAVAAAKGLLRLEGAGEDALLGRLAGAAAGLGEAFLGRAIDPVWETVPAPIAHGLVLLVAHLWENRGRDDAPPAAVTALWRPFRVLTL